MARSPSLKTEFLALLLRFARWRPVRPLVPVFFQHLGRFLPVDRLGENAHWIACDHPSPAYPVHILILPKQAIPSLPCAPDDHPDLFADLFSLVQSLIRDLELEPRGYRLITNGGPNQSIPVWHWHLVSETPCEEIDNPGETHDRNHRYP